MKTQQTDREKYDELNREMLRMIHDKQTKIPRFQEAWNEFEAVKNRHGGNPPPQTI
jgi:hypothetical protein